GLAPAGGRSARGKFHALSVFGFFPSGSVSRRGNRGDNESFSRTGHHRRAGRAASIEWTRFRTAGQPHTRGDAGDESQQLFHERGQQRSGGTRILFFVRWWLTSQRNRLASRRCRQQ